MADRIQAIRGMNDILPAEAAKWAQLETLFRNCMQRYGYQEIRLPLLESTALFRRSIGEVTDIVEKEMYTFNDLNGESITLRPEGTAGCVRACLEQGLLHNSQQKLWYMGPMFRHEKPQKGRYRQFNQLGVETFGFTGPAIELELIALTSRLWKELGIHEQVKLQINTLGERAERQSYREKLVAFFTEHQNELDEDSQRRLKTNPLRILDSKNPLMQPLLAKVPSLIDTSGEKSRQHFEELCAGLEVMGIDYTINSQLVRGLDYYNHTVFEWVTDKLGSQATICGGGRYDSLVEELGGVATPCFGFSIGAERILILLDTMGIDLTPAKSGLTLFLMASSFEGLKKALVVAEELRSFNQSWSVITNTRLSAFKSQFKKADKSRADFAIIFGEDEIRNGELAIKNLRFHEDQIRISQETLIPYLTEQSQK